ncbi:MAG: C-terminal binding protein [Pseudomonadota bacterium]
MLPQQSVVVVLEPGYTDYAPERERLEPLGISVLSVPAERDAADNLKDRNVVALLVRERSCHKVVMDACPNLKAIVRYGVGVDNIDLAEATERKIYVANIPDYATSEVSDHAVALYLAVARRIITRDTEVRRGLWGIGQGQIIAGHRGATLGLIGFGRIARATWARFKALGFARALVTDPALTPEAAVTLGVDVAPLDRICAEADVLSLHAPLTDATRHLLDDSAIRLMKPTAILVNVGRGGLVDEQALAAALNERRIFGAGIDVFEVEPPAQDNPLLSTPNTVVSDHTGWYSEASVRHLQTHAADELVRVLSGETPLNWVNRW